MTRFLFILGLALTFALPASAQDLKLPAPSPLASAMQTVGTTEVTVTWSSPGKKDREIYGGLVPFDTLWRTGANRATTIEFSSDVKVAGQMVPAGKYAVFSIPGKAAWTVILNTNPNQGGTGSYDEALDQVRFEVTPMEAPVRERMTFVFENTTADATTLVLDWAGTRVDLPITVDTTSLATAAIKDYAGSVGGTLSRAARHLLETDGDLTLAGSLADAAVAADRNWFNLWIKAWSLRAQGDNKAALAYAKESYDLGMQADSFFYKDRIEAALTDWKKKKK